MDKDELMELVNRREEIHPYLLEKERRNIEPDGPYSYLFWFTVITGIVCAAVLVISYILEIWPE